MMVWLHSPREDYHVYVSEERTKHMKLYALLTHRKELNQASTDLIETSDSVTHSILFYI